jgi:transposase-like protein
MTAERGVFVDHATVHRWSPRALPAFARAFRCGKHLAGKSWCMEEAAGRPQRAGCAYTRAISARPGILR